MEHTVESVMARIDAIAMKLFSDNLDAIMKYHSQIRPELLASLQATPAFVSTLGGAQDSQIETLIKSKIGIPAPLAQSGQDVAVAKAKEWFGKAATLGLGEAEKLKAKFAEKGGNNAAENTNTSQTEFRQKLPPKKLYYAGFGAGALSLFLPWADVGIARSNGFEQLGFICLLLMLYPFVTLYKGATRHKILNVTLSIVNIAITFCYLAGYQTDFMGTTINISGSGLFMMMLATFIVCAAAVMEPKKAK